MVRSFPILFFTALLCACHTTAPSETVDGILEVPENRKKSHSRTLKLVYKVLKAKKADSLKAPIVYLQGGPGAATLTMEEFWKNHPLRKDRDIVLMDQRGTGASEANCVEIGDAMFAVIRQDLDNEGEIRELNAILSKCKETMEQKGVDLAGYTSKENAADFEDLRKALGYEKWNLFGVSYGSRLGLTIMRDFPNSVRSAVLAAILAPETDYLNESFGNFEHSLFSVLGRCQKNQDCNGQFPNLKERLLKTLEKLRSDPLRLDYKGQPFVLNAQDAFLLLHVSLYNRHSIGNIPLLIEALESGETESLLPAIQGMENLYGLINWPMNFSVMIYEELPFYNEAAMVESLERSEIAVRLPLFSDSSMEVLDNWHPHRASKFENQAVVSEIPTLMASGGLDHVTPVGNATAALKHLKNSYGILFSDDGHNLFNPCFFRITEDFLNDPLHEPNLDCSAIRKPLEWNPPKPAQ